MLRVITGKAKGKKLIAPEKGTRPLTDRIKTSIFDLIRDFIPDAAVLDLFAGSGSFGIESISRGAKDATFIDLGSRAIECIEENLANTNFFDQATVIQTKVNDFIATTDKSFDLIFMDPPFDQKLEMDFPSLKKILKDDGLIIYRIPSEDSFVLREKDLEIVYEKTYGKSTVYFLKKR